MSVLDFFQSVLIPVPTLGAADGVELHGQIPGAHGGEDIPGHGDDLRVRAGLGGAEALHAELVVLPKPAGLGPFIAEHGAVEIVDLHGHGLGEEPVLHEHAHGPRRALGLQRDAAAALVVEGVHLLLHHVRGVAYGAQKELRMFDDRGPYLLEAIAGGGPADQLLHILPAIAFRRGNVPGPFGCLICHSPSSCYEKAAPSPVRDGRPRCHPD